MQHQYARLIDGHVIEIGTSDGEHIEGAAVAFCGRLAPDPCYEPIRAEDRQDDNGEVYPVLVVSVPTALVSEWWSAERYTIAAERGFQ